MRQMVIGVIALRRVFVASYVGARHEPWLKNVAFGAVPPQVEAVCARRSWRSVPAPGRPIRPARRPVWAR
jgi:hypothetical protein